MASAPRRPDPDALLARATAESASARGGKLKVFLGAAPGVGKTFAMLAAARELSARGVDVVVGLVETHGRAETRALLEGLEVLPRRHFEYKGHDLEEMDLDALLARRPELALVDELAHTNVPGSRHERRYQDVLELLDAGIDVHTTVNVQHLESLNDVVEQLTGVRVRETVPDAFLDRLDEIVLVDLPPRELIERLRQGKVYVAERARAALERFFSPANLAALRELALQTAVERVDIDLREDRAAQSGEHGVGIRPRLLVAVDGHEHTEYLVRIARRMAERRQMPWTVVHVETGATRSRTDPASLGAAFQLAGRLGADAVTLRGDDVADELLAFAQRHGVTALLVGRSRERPIARLLNRTITQRLLDRGAHLELTIVSTPLVRRRARRRLETGATTWRDRARDAALATFVTALSTGVAAVLQPWLPVASLAMVFLCGVVVVAVRTRRTASVFAALGAFLAYNFFFTEPRLTFRIQGAEDVVAVFSFLIAALLCGHLAWRLRAQVVRLRAANEHAARLTALGQELAAAVDEPQVWRAGCARLAELLGCRAVALTRDAENRALRHAGSQPPGLELSGNDLAAADWVVAHATPAGRFTTTLAASPWWLVPLVVERGCLGTVGLLLPADGVPPAEEQRSLAEAMVQQLAFAVDRTRLAASLETARTEGESERLRTALLSSVSHDLRSPLTAVIGAATSLASYGGDLSGSEQRELLELIRSEGERLDRYIQNLLDMTRLGSGPMKLERDWIGVDELVASAVARLRRLVPGAEVDVEIAAGLPPLHVHPALIEQAVFNLLENAAKFSPEGAAIGVRAARSNGALVLEVRDRGPGIPEDERRRVFDLFYRAARGDRAPRGSGLGLTIVRGLVGAHQGKVEAFAGEGGVGTTIRVTLPLSEPPKLGAPDEEA